MRPTPPGSKPGAPRGPDHSGARRRQASAGLKILVAGVDKDSRGWVENVVKRALQPRTATESWTVSVVKLAGKWSLTLHGPGERFRNVSVTADEHRLAEAIREALGGSAGPSGTIPPGAPVAAPVRGASAAAAPAAAPAPSSAGERRERHGCERCGQAFVVVYEAQANEARMLAPVACPHCWSVNHVEIGAWAASGRDYRADKG